jgi:hypothetical protein
MANLATSDAVLSEFFAANKVCDKLELATNIDSQHVRFMTALQAKHGAGTDFNDQDIMKMSAALDAYVNRLTANVSTSDPVLAAYFAADGLYSKISASTKILGFYARKLSWLKNRFDAGTDFRPSDREYLVPALEAYLRAAI